LRPGRLPGDGGRDPEAARPGPALRRGPARPALRREGRRVQDEGRADDVEDAAAPPAPPAGLSAPPAPAARGGRAVRAAALASAGLALLQLVLLAHTAWDKSDTGDEPTYLGAAALMWTHR